jgi:hypothetical protein
MPQTQTIDSKALSQLSTNDKDQINQFLDSLFQDFGGDELGIPMKGLPGRLGTILKAIEVAPLVLSILADITTIMANVTSMARDIYEVKKISELSCLCEELRCMNNLTKQTEFPYQHKQALMEGIATAILSLGQYERETIYQALQGFSIDDVPAIVDDNSPDPVTTQIPSLEGGSFINHPLSCNNPTP